jgi:hypothetical protein
MAVATFDAQPHGQVAGQQVDVVGEVLPRAVDTGHPRLATELAFGADLRATRVTSAAKPFS